MDKKQHEGGRIKSFQYFMLKYIFFYLHVCSSYNVKNAEEIFTTEIDKKAVKIQCDMKRQEGSSFYKVAVILEAHFNNIDRI
jgi:hypothetical protein